MDITRDMTSFAIESLASDLLTADPDNVDVRITLGSWRDRTISDDKAWETLNLIDDARSNARAS